MVRWVNSIDEKELQVESRTGMTATLKRGENAKEPFDKGVKALDEKQLDRAFDSKGITGYVPKETTDGKHHRWILRSKIGSSDKATQKKGDQGGAD